MKIRGGRIPPTAEVPYLPSSVVLLLLFAVGCSSSSSSSSGGGGGGESSFVDATSPGGTFQRLLVNRHSGRVYVGATNRLYQLSGALDLEAKVDNGPKEDNPNCPPPASECQCFGSNCKDFEKTQMDSVSKALVIDYRGDRLISCINLYQGHCDKHLLTDIRQKDNAIWTMLVPNDEDSPVVMFVAPGPPNPASTDVLYVAATRSTRGLPAYKDIVPAICMRSLQDLNFVSDDILTPSRIEIEVQQRDQFRVQYVYGFGSVGFSYFLMVQKPSALAESEQFITQMSRICQNDKSLYSYTEVPLECHHRGVNYSILRAAFLGYPGTNLAKSLGLPHIAPLTDMEHVLVAVFSNQTTAKAAAASSSALCVYPMREIRKVFTETIQKCFQGTGNTGPDHFVQPKICQNTPLEIADDYCGQHDLNHPIKGTDPVLGQAVIAWNGVNVTSVAVTQTTDFTVAFLGTDDGHLKKVTIESRHSATEFGSTLIERNGSIVGSSLSFDPTQEHIYVMTARKVSRVPVQNCSQYTTCQQCLQARDPYCGWCSLERRCSLRTNCSSVEGVGSWLPYDLGQCPKVIAISSTQAQKQSGSTTMIIISVGHLPQQLFTDLRCSFKGFGVTRVTMTTTAQTNGRPSENSTLRCDTPTANLLPPFPTGKDHIVMNLSLVSDGHDFLPVTNFTFFDCSIHNTCTLCTKSSFPCTWCVEGHHCTSNKELCTSNVLVTGKHMLGSSDTPGPEFCPRIESKKPNSTEILVASGSEIRLQVRAVHLIQKYHSMFKCVFNFNGGVERNATLLRNGQETDVVCDPVLFNYSSPSPYLNVPFSVLWGARRRSLDNPNSVQVRVFKCSKMASNCGLCRSIGLTHGCGWCAASNRCSVQENCLAGQWLSRREPCQNPTIHQIFPTSGPIEGGTSLTISGENLGIHADETAASAADFQCHISHYIIPSAKLVCVTGSSKNVTHGPVVLNISGKYKAESSTQFNYVKPEVYGFRPDVGPVSGGTLLTIFGRNLDAGSNATVLMTGGGGGGPSGSWKVRCGVVSRDGSHVVCATGEGGRSPPPPQEANLVRLQIDSGVVDYSEGRFRFVPDPVVVMVDPEKTILSGGIRIFVTGERLGSVSHPRLVIYVPGANVTGPCKIIDEGRMICTSPSLSVPGGAAASPLGGGAPHWDPAKELSAGPVSLHYGFIMDGVRAVRNISGSGSRGMMVAHPDPTFEAFDEGVKQFFYSKNEYLIINGKNINAVLNESDFRVDVGGVECVVKTVTSSQLMCLPSEQEAIPPTASVEVRIGNYSVYVGDLKYDSSDNVFTFTTIIAVTVAAGICLLIIIVICLAYRRKTKESERVVKHFTNQMNTLEARVATECKEAFAELQTDMVHVTSDICEQGGIPFRDYSSFCVRVMFPEDRSNDHPIMRSFDADNPSTEKAERGLDIFNHLVGNKTFLLIFIRVLEQQSDFTAREKVNVASLLSVTLQNRMEYHTDILRTLLADLIERAINGIHPKLLLRRTESVAEKMLTNWFTFLLYRFLRESAGEPLFLLFCAIKRQVEKGPIDALTSEAKYSLSEDKLIRQQLDFQVLTLAIVDPDSTVSCEVKVMDCDTITQAKEKILDAIYRSTPFSARPDKDDLDLEWLNHSQSKTRFVLQDEDASTRLEGDVRRLNTLAYYRVPRDGARMALAPRRLDSVVNLSLSSEKIPPFRDGFYNGSLPHSQSLSMSHTIRFMPEMGARSYHLIKSQENESNRNAKVEQCNKLVSEIYLTRLLATKMALDQFVKTLFETIFSTAGGNASLPLAIKYLFDFLDDQAVHHGITDPEVVHTWKSNSLPLRFWVNVIKNPDFIFDVHKSNIVDSCLSVVAQTFMDSCSMSEHKLSKDSPSSKLLYAKDIPGFKDMVISYYENIKRMPSVSDHEIQAMLRDESQIHKNEFNQSAALFELYLYTTKYSKDLMQELDSDEFACRNHLAQQLELVHRSMEPEV